MHSGPVTLDELLIAHLQGKKGFAEICRALDAERTNFRKTINDRNALTDALRQTLRDQFAMAALPACLREDGERNRHREGVARGYRREQTISAWAYALADQMLATREMPTENVLRAAGILGGGDA